MNLTRTEQKKVAHKFDTFVINVTSRQKEKVI